MDEFTTAYITCALWAESGEAESPLGASAYVDEISPQLRAQMIADCAKFQNEAGELIAEDFTQAGHDFWLTRRGHGSGFWDGDWPPNVGDTLTALSKTFGDCDLYRGDDGLIYA